MRGGSVKGNDGKNAPDCPVFGVRSGYPVIGLGILLLLFAIFPLFFLPGTMPVAIAVLFGGFGAFLILAGLTQ